MFSDLKTIFRKGFHERIVLLLLYLEKRSKIKLLFKIVRKLIIQCGYHCEIHPDSFRDAKAIATCSLPHPFMIIIHKGVSLGRNLRIFQGVTIGDIEKGKVEVPYIGDGVYIGTKASVLGGVVVGDNAKIGAHTLVLCDVQPNQTVCGVYNKK